jgi:tRNA-dihydrouridine synthase
MVTRKVRGAGLLPHPGRIRDVLERVFASPPCRFSAKIRLGVDRPDQVFDVVPVLNDYPLCEVIIHPRTAVQMYEGVADAEAFDDCRRRLKHRVVYNGDIRTVRDYERLASRLPEIHDWMLGRGLVADPFLAARIVGDPVDRELETVRRFHDELYAQYKGVLFGARPVLGKMKELWSYLSRSFRDGGTILKKIQRSTTLEAYETIVERFFDERAEWIAQYAGRIRCPRLRRGS